MKGNLILKNNIINENKNYNGRYLFQYELKDFNNEIIPITDYISSKEYYIGLICSNNFGINIKNDREEKRESKLSTHMSCENSNFKYNEIINNENYFKSEKIFLLISNLRVNKKMNKNEEENLDKFIKENILETINENGYYTYSNDTKNRNISYIEPKSYFSLINYFANYYNKNYLNTDIDFFNYFNIIFEEIFKNETISNKTLSDSDIKSLFRTLDNLYDIYIRKNLPIQKKILSNN